MLSRSKSIISSLVVHVIHFRPKGMQKHVNMIAWNLFKWLLLHCYNVTTNNIVSTHLTLMESKRHEANGAMNLRKLTNFFLLIQIVICFSVYTWLCRWNISKNSVEFINRFWLFSSMNYHRYVSLIGIATIQFLIINNFRYFINELQSICKL